VTQSTEGQRTRWEAAGERAGAKLGNFISGLPDDEQQILTVALSVASINLARLADEGQDPVEVEGHSMNLANSLIRSVREHPYQWIAAGLAVEAAAKAAGGNWAAVYNWAKGD
jgi:hypothetical protein